jgi:hypothetical protein
MSQTVSFVLVQGMSFIGEFYLLFSERKREGWNAFFSSAVFNWL